MITLTDTAIEKVVEFMKAEERDGLSLRLTVRRHGQRKFQYELNLEEAEDRRPGDVTQDCGEFELRIDPASAGNVEGSTMDFEQRGFESGFKFDNPQANWDDPVAQAVQQILDQQINPAVASHGGVIDLVAVEDHVAILSFGGGCQGCGMVDVTLKEGVEGAILNAVPEIKEVRDVTDHAAGENPYFESDGQSPF